MAPKQRYRLKLSKLDFISAVDSPAQETATALLIKRAKTDTVALTAKVAKVDDELGLVFGWAFTTQIDGAAYFDLQGDNVDGDFVKAAAEFMQGGGLTDEMHDSSPDGRVVFCMPMTPDVAKAFGVVSKTVGLMVAIKPSADVFAKFKSGEYTGFSIAGLGERTPVDKKRKRQAVAKHLFARVLKESVLTSESDGHVHAIDLDDPSTSWCSMYSTSYQTAEGATEGHSHSWTFDPVTGAITIGMDSGHDHTVAAVVPPDVLAAFAALDAAQDAHNAAVAAAPIAVDDDPSDGIPMPLAVEESSGAVINVSIAARAPASKSTPRSHAPSVKPQPEIPKMNLAKMLAAILAMNASQQAYVGKLAPDEVEPFFTKSAAERDAIMKAAAEADPVVFTGEVTKLEVRKSDGVKTLELAKLNEQHAATIAKQTTEIAKANEARQVEIYKARAKAEIGHIGGSDDVKVALLKAVDGIADEKLRGEAITALKSADAFAKSAGVAKGIGGVDVGGTTDKAGAYEALAKGLVAFATEKKIEKVWTDGLDAFVQTQAGAELQRAYDQASK